MVVAVILQGFDTGCISIHHTHVTLISLDALCFSVALLINKVDLFCFKNISFMGEQQIFNLLLSPESVQISLFPSYFITFS